MFSGEIAKLALKEFKMIKFTYNEFISSINIYINIYIIN